MGYDTPTDPTADDGAYDAKDPIAKCTTDCPDMEIQIDESPSKGDVVQVKSEHPGRRYTVKYKIRATTKCSTASTVVLTNPDKRLRFTGPSDLTTTVTVSGNGSWTGFEISGEVGSKAVGDAVIEAHCNSEKGPLKASKAITVFWFDDAHIDVTKGSDYSVSNAVTPAVYIADPGAGVTFTAKARIRPDKIDCTLPRIKDLRIGIVQTALAGNGASITYTPSMAWDASQPKGTTKEIVASLLMTASLNTDANDSRTEVAPLYDQPGKGANITVDENSLKPPMGCAGGAPATSRDTAQVKINPPGFDIPMVDDTGAPLGKLTYSFQKCEIHISLVTWCAVFDPSTNDVTVLKERTWSLQADSSKRAQHCVPAASETDPTRDPVLTGGFGNDSQQMQGPKAGPGGHITIKKAR